MNDRVRRRRQEQRRRKLQVRLGVGAVALAVVVVVLVVALSARGDDGPQLSEAAQVGRETAVARSCVGCHGRDGEGGANGSGPAWVGLFGSTVTLDDGTTVVADHDYLLESILDPRAKQVAGWGMMPVDSISAADAQAIVTYIEALATPAPSSP